MHYLSVYDLVWINTTVTGDTVPYDYEKLESAMAAQYSYGDSDRVLDQAANLLTILLTAEPFLYGNRRTAFIAALTYLSANGYAIKVNDHQAADILGRAADGAINGGDAVGQLVNPSETVLREGVTLRQVVSHLCNEHTEALELLREGDDKR